MAKFKKVVVVDKMMGSKKTKKRDKTRGGGMRGRGLDTAAAQYAKLLAEPCTAPLVHPIFPGGNAGFLMRSEGFLTVGNGVDQTSGYFNWVPGYVNKSGTEALYAASNVPDAQLPVETMLNGAPGKTFLANSTSAYRCIAASIKITFPGSEHQRSGRIHYGNTAAGLIEAGTTQSPNGVAQTLQNYGRTPADVVELVWRPGQGDCNMTDPNSLPAGPMRDTKSAMTIAWAGLPPGVGLTLHMTAVYEWLPVVGLGLGSNGTGKAVSGNTLDDVLDYLTVRGFAYVRQAGTALGAGVATGLAATLAQSYGMMGSRQHARALRY